MKRNQTVNEKIDMKRCSMMLIEKPQKYLHYHLKHLINMTILQVRKYLLIKLE